MGETAEERRRRLALQNNAYANAMNASTTIIRFGKWSNDDYDYPNYWDFKFNATDRYYIQAELMDGAGSGCAVILIGFSDRK